ncbi:MAG: twin-arginine translocase subunit TatC [Chloroflexota bacterium]|nr:twin-arginine translocase subunit TatC [Chloroflexota bacterium]
MARLIDTAPRAATPGTATPAAPEPNPSPLVEGKVMTLAEHLTELRRRLIVAALAVGVGSVIGFWFSPDLLRVLAAPVPGPLYFTQPGGALFLQLKLAVLIGIVLASPVVLYQLWAFVSPGLTPRERQAAWPWLPLAVIFLVLGIGLAYAILPMAVTFLLGFQIEGVIEPLIRADDYFGFALMLFAGFGLALQFPILLVLLSKLGIVTVARLRRARRYVLLGIFVLAALLTPPDPLSQLIMGGAMYGLFELSILLIGRTPAARADG